MKIDEGKDQTLPVHPGEVGAESGWVERLEYFVQGAWRF